MKSTLQLSGLKAKAWASADPLRVDHEIALGPDLKRRAWAQEDEGEKKDRIEKTQ